MQNLYGIKQWSDGYFSINGKGHVTVKPKRSGEGGDLYELIQTLVQQGIEAPILIRFNGIIEDRIKRLHNAFKAAIKEMNYRNGHRMAFPIKVNPQRHVVEIVAHAGRHFQVGLEVGSKPELMAVMALDSTPDMLLLCNGYKDAEYISLALIARKLGKRTVIIIEQSYELKLVLDIAEQLGIEAELGFRMKLSNKGTGKWKSSGGEHSKFGLFSYEIIAALEELKKREKAHWLKLLHFHIGSQITTIQSIKKALNEGSKVYTELAFSCPSLEFFDVGGGLAVDYDGTKSQADSSMNYSLEEYARDVISVIGEACLEKKVAEPIIITESGRATVAHHALLVIEVIDVTSTPQADSPFIPPSNHSILNNLQSMYDELNEDNCRETFHDAQELKERILDEFIYGKLSLTERAYAEKLYRLLLLKIRGFYLKLPDAAEEKIVLDKTLSEIYFCNFSVFQSLPDSWAISQLFPIMPIHRLNEPATHQAVLADLSCDSDGKIDTFIGTRGPINYLMLHEYQGEPYYLGIFLIGAYQEILGGLHNLFGDANVAHATLNEHGAWELSRIVEGDTIEEVLHYVQYNTERIMDQLYQQIERSQQAGRITLLESAAIKKKFKQSLENYTYLVV